MLQTVVVIYTILVGIIYGDYDYSYSQTSSGERGECVFSGSISTGGTLCKQRSISRRDYTQGGDLTWKILTDVCPNLIYAGCADPDWTDGPDHNITRDLEWPQYCWQGCPRCPCHNGEVDKYYLNNYTQFDTSGYAFQVSECVQCSCNYYWDRYDENLEDDITIYARSCSVGTSSCGSGDAGDACKFDSPDELDHVVCPYTTPKPTPQPTGGCEDGAGNNYPPGEGFFYWDEDKCDTYCICNSTNGLDCQQGWENILNGGDRMRISFLNDCGSYVDDAWDDPSRWVKRNGYDVYCSENWITSAGLQCPVSDCGMYNYTEMWNDSVTVWSYGYYDEEEMMVTTELYNCVSCECNSDIYKNSSDTVDCDAYRYSVKNASQCDFVPTPVEDVYMNCSSDETGNYKIDDYDTDTTTIRNETIITKKLLDTTSCSVPEEYCGWSKLGLIDGFDPDTVCITGEFGDGRPDWGCQEDLYCIAAFGYDKLQESETGFCSKNEISFTVKDFDCIDFEFKSETYTIDYNYMCCGKEAGDYCNAQRPSAEALEGGCPSNGGLAGVFKSLYECYYGDRGITNNDYWKQLKCGVDLPDASNVKSRVCDLIESRWLYETACDCGLKQGIEKLLGNSDYEDGLREDMQLEFDSSFFTLMTNLEEWNEYYECGKTFECDIYDSVNTLKLSFLTILFIAFVNYFL